MNEVTAEINKAVELTPEQMSVYGEYFEDGLDHPVSYPKLYYDCMLFRARDEQGYYYGTVAAHAYDALQSGGYFILNINETAQDVDKIVSLFSLFFTYMDKESDSNFYVFKKE